MVNRIGWAVALFLALITAAFAISGAHYRRQALRNALVADSVLAIADTSRAEAWGFERRAIQAERARDSLDRALKRSTVVRGVVRIVTPPDTIVLSAPVDSTANDSLRFGRFVGYQRPYHVVADVMLPRPPGIGSLNLAIVSDTAQFGLRVQCGEKVRGIRPATLVLEPPDWMVAQIDSAQVTPLACNEAAVRAMRWSLGGSVGTVAKVAVVTVAAVKVAQWLKILP